MKTVLVPKENKVDVDELALEITKGLDIIPVENMDEVLKLALVKEEPKKTAGSAARKLAKGAGGARKKGEI